MNNMQVIGERVKRARHLQVKLMEIGDIYTYVCIYIHIVRETSL